MPNAWPPPPDLASIQELMREADPEGHIAGGAPADEYEPEEEEFFAAIQLYPTADLVAANLSPILEDIWRRSFALDEAALALRRPALLRFAAQVERFFGPEATPQVRTA